MVSILDLCASHEKDRDVRVTHAKLEIDVFVHIRHHSHTGTYVHPSSCNGAFSSHNAFER
jgi:hypothetical protein